VYVSDLRPISPPGESGSFDHKRILSTVVRLSAMIRNARSSSDQPNWPPQALQILKSIPVRSQSHGPIENTLELLCEADFHTTDFFARARCLTQPFPSIGLFIRSVFFLDTTRRCYALTVPAIRRKSAPCQHFVKSYLSSSDRLVCGLRTRP